MTVTECCLLIDCVHTHLVPRPFYVSACISACAPFFFLLSLPPELLLLYICTHIHDTCLYIYDAQQHTGVCLDLVVWLSLLNGGAMWVLSPLPLPYEIWPLTGQCCTFG